MIEEIYTLYKLIKQMNNAGYDMLCEVARDIISHEKYKKETVAQIKTSRIGDDLDEAVAMANGWR